MSGASKLKHHANFAFIAGFVAAEHAYAQFSGRSAAHLQSEQLVKIFCVNYIRSLLLIDWVMAVRAFDKQKIISVLTNTRIRAAVVLPLLLLAPALAATPLPVSRPQPSDAYSRFDGYMLGRGDQLELTLMDPSAKNLNSTVEVLNDGSIGLEVIGNVMVSGLTLDQAKRRISQLYSRYLKRPDLNLKVLRPRPIQVSMVGEVENPGLYSLTVTEISETSGAKSTSINGLPTVVTALQKAGGLTLEADIEDVLLRRRLPGKTGDESVINLNLLALLETGDKRQNPFLFDGDTIVIKRSATPNQRAMELAAANLSPKTIGVNIVGEVVSPGRLQLKANTPLVQAILAAGGPKTWRAKHSNIELVRVNRDNTATHEFYSLSYNEGATNAGNPPLREGDTVIVNRSGYAVVTDAFQAITAPLAPLVNLGSGIGLRLMP